MQAYTNELSFQAKLQLELELDAYTNRPSPLRVEPRAAREHLGLFASLIIILLSAFNFLIFQSINKEKK